MTDTTGLEARLRASIIEATKTSAQQRDEIARLREALVTAAIPLEAMRLSGSDRMHCPEVEAGIAAGIEAARQALEPRP